ncbi:MAG TPA: ribose-5-phosphate isomerase RpiA [Caulobacteraceae bacterium]|jgi:ribose 5-phosphate isomerase A
MSADIQKRVAGEAAAALIEPGMTVGLGSGSTSALFVEALAARELKIRAVATSVATATLARRLGIEVLDLDAVDHIDLTVDGADQIGPSLSLIKGGGAALLREKLVWEASRRCVAIADHSKLEGPFGRFPLPIEVVAFGHRSTAARVTGALKACGISAPPKLREKDGTPVVTDGGNLIYDAACGEIPDPVALGMALKRLTGVVEHGLFVGLAERALVATPTGVDTLWP